jgi:hypothetical protein
MLNLEVAFLNTKKNFEDAHALCESLGAGWHAPASNSPYADPRANDSNHSLEALGEYFKGTTPFWFWSSSSVSSNTSYAWYVSMAYGGTYGYPKYTSNNVVCVRP